MTDRDRLMAVAAEAARRLNAVAQAGEAGRVNRQLIRALADEGLLGRVFPASAGGKQPARLSAVDLCLVREGLARESTAVENALTIQALGAYPIVVAGSDEQIRRQVIPAVRGEAVAAFALTEPDAGTDAGALALRAERVAGGYRLSGVKAFISNAPDADFYTLFARTTPDTRSRGITAFIVAGQASGLKGTALSLISDHPIGRLASR